MWTAVWTLTPTWLKLLLAAILVASAAYLLGTYTGARDERQAAQTKAIKEAAARVGTMEKNNAEFRKASPRDRCLAIMRDSGLPDSACD